MKQLLPHQVQLKDGTLIVVSYSTAAETSRPGYLEAKFKKIRKEMEQERKQLREFIDNNKHVFA